MEALARFARRLTKDSVYIVDVTCEVKFAAEIDNWRGRWHSQREDHRSANDLFAFKLLGIASCVLVAYAGIGVVWLLHRRGLAGEYKAWIGRANSFAAGVLLAVSLVHTLPDAKAGFSALLLEVQCNAAPASFNAVSDSVEGEAWGIVVGFATLAYIILAILERVVERVLSRDEPDATDATLDVQQACEGSDNSNVSLHAGDQNCLDARGSHVPNCSPQSTLKMSTCGETGGLAVQKEHAESSLVRHDLTHSGLIVRNTGHVLRSYVLFSALMFHSLVEGLGFGGNQRLSVAIGVLLAIVAHKGLAAFALAQTLLGGLAVPTKHFSGSKSKESCEKGDATSGRLAASSIGDLARPLLSGGTDPAICAGCPSCPLSRAVSLGETVVAESTMGCKSMATCRGDALSIGSFLPEQFRGCEEGVRGTRVVAFTVPSGVCSSTFCRAGGCQIETSDSNSAIAASMACRQALSSKHAHEGDCEHRHHEQVHKEASRSVQLRFLMFTQMFSLSTPLGAFLGLLYVDTRGSGHRGEISLLYFTTICTALTSGTFFYIAIEELIPHNLFLESAAPTSEKMWRYSSLIVGFVVMSLLALLGA